MTKDVKEDIVKAVETDVDEAVDELEAGLEDVVVDVELPEVFALETDANDRLQLVTAYNRYELQLRASKNTAQKEEHKAELERAKNLVYGQLQRLDLKWKIRGKLSKLRSVQKEIAEAQAKVSQKNRKRLLEADDED